MRGFTQRGITITALAVFVGIVAPSVAQANVNISSGSSCGLHAGKVLRRDSGGTIYRFRMGPRMYHSGGDMKCKGHVRRQSAANTTDGCCSIDWQPFSLPNWRHYFNARVLNTDATAGLTAYGCQSFGEALAATIITEGFATPALVIGGAGCAYGVYKLGPKIPSGINSLLYVKVVK